MSTARVNSRCQTTGPGAEIQGQRAIQEDSKTTIVIAVSVPPHHSCMYVTASPSWVFQILSYTRP